MSRFLIGALILIFALSLLTSVIYLYFSTREGTRQKKMEMRHERTMKEQEMLFDQDDEIDRELERNDR